MAEQKSTADNSGEKHEVPILEWFAAAAGLILVVGAIGFFLYQAIYYNSTPPNISVAVESVTPADSGYLVTFKAYNSGDQTAANVAVEGEFENSGESGEKSDVTIGYVPAYSTTKGGLFFSKDPRQFNLKIRATGYAVP